MTNSDSILIVAKPGPLFDGLYALLAAMPRRLVIDHVDDVASLWMTRQSCPALVLLDGDLLGEGSSICKRLRAEWPQARYIVLADNVQQQLEAQAAGAECILKGFPATKLLAMIQGRA
jgi:DNA-binding NarL/FixJ family response regulator